MLTMLVAAAFAATPVSAKADAAAQIAHALTPRESFRSMILMTLDQGNAGAGLAKAVGAPRADALLAEAAEEMSFRYAETWEANLAAAYRTALTPAELAAVLAGVHRDDYSVLAPVSARVGGAFYRNSESLLRRATDEAVRQATDEANRSAPIAGS
jgi:hypothetical protein